MSLAKLETASLCYVTLEIKQQIKKLKITSINETRCYIQVQTAREGRDTLTRTFLSPQADPSVWRSGRCWVVARMSYCWEPGDNPGRSGPSDLPPRAPAVCSPSTWNRTPAHFLFSPAIISQQIEMEYQMEIWLISQDLPRHKIYSCICFLRRRTGLNTLHTSERSPVSACEAAFSQSRSPGVSGCHDRLLRKIFWCRETWWRGTGTPATPPSQSWWWCRAPRTSGRPWRRKCWRWPSCRPPRPGDCPPRTLLSDWTEALRSLTCVENKGAISHLTENIYWKYLDQENISHTRKRYLSWWSAVRAEILTIFPSFKTSLVGDTRSMLSPMDSCTSRSFLNCSILFIESFAWAAAWLTCCRAPGKELKDIQILRSAMESRR